MNIKIIMDKFVIFLMSFFVVSPSLAVPVDSIKEDVPVLFLAINKEDIELYSTEMKNLLYGPVEKFTETILFTTKEGDTIFHLMAGVRSHQRFFTREMQNLNSAFFSRESTVDGHLSLGGVTISIPHLEDTDLGKAIKNRNLSKILSIANHLDTASAMDWLTNFHAKPKDGRSLKDFAFKHLNMEQLLYIRDQGIEKEVKKYIQTSSFLLTKNNQSLSPGDIAYKSENPSAYAFISDFIEKSSDFTLLRDGLIIGVGVVGFLLAASSLLISGDWLWPYSEMVLDSNSEIVSTVFLLKGMEVATYGTVGGVASGFVAKKCSDLFKKMKINKLRKKENSKRRQL